MSQSAAFIRHLGRLAEGDPGKTAILRRSLAYEPGADVRAYPMVEAHVASDWPWRRTAYYLVAGLWASVNTVSFLARASLGEDEEEPASSGGAATVSGDERSADARRGPDRRSFGYAVARLYRQRNRTESIEQRFIALLDADEEQLPYRLRQMVQLVKGEDEIRIHWAVLLDDVLDWPHEERRVQRRWARAFYREVGAAPVAATVETDGNDGNETGA